MCDFQWVEKKFMGAFALCMYSTIFVLWHYSHSFEYLWPPSGPTCEGICDLSLYPLSTVQHNNHFALCGPIDPSLIFYVRIMKTASTRFMSLLENEIRPKKGFGLRETPDYPGAVAQSPEWHQWDLRRVIVSDFDKHNYYSDLRSEVYQKDRRAPYKLFYYGHNFLPTWEMYHLYREKLKAAPTVITFVKDPITRMASAYNYIRRGALTYNHQHRNLKLLGNATVAECHFNQTCADINALRRR